MHPIKLLLTQPQLLTSLPSFLWQSAVFFGAVTLILFVFSIPFRRKSLLPESLSLLALPLGFVHLLVFLSIAASFIPFRLMAAVTVLYGIGWLLVGLWWYVKKNLDIQINPSLLLIYMALYFVLIFSSFDLKNRVFYVPGYHNNHDAVTILSAVTILQQSLSLRQNVAYHFGNGVLLSYPGGGIYATALMSNLFNVSAYNIYFRLIAYGYVLALYPLASIFLSLQLKRVGLRGLEIGLISISLFNYLAVGLINTAVLGSTVSAVLVLLWLSLMIWYLNDKLSVMKFTVLGSLTLIALMYFYLYFQLPIILCSVLSVLWFKVPLKKLKPIIITLILGLTLSLIVPEIYRSFIWISGLNFNSSMREASLFNGMLGNLIGFVHPLAVVSIRFFQADYRFGQENVISYLLLGGLVVYGVWMLYKKPPTSHSIKTILFLISSYVPFVLFTLLVTKSPYQNVKVYQQLVVVIPLLVYALMIHRLEKLSTKLFIGLYITVSLLSASFSYRYIQPPPEDTYFHVNPAALPCRLDQTEELPFNWYDYLNITCEAAS